MRIKKLRATRSTDRIERALPLTWATLVPALICDESPTSCLKSTVLSIMAKAVCAKAIPERTPPSLAAKTAKAVALAGIVELVVMSPASPKSSSRAMRTVFSIKTGDNSGVRNSLIILHNFRRLLICFIRT